MSLPSKVWKFAFFVTGFFFVCKMLILGALELVLHVCQGNNRVRPNTALQILTAHHTALHCQLGSIFTFNHNMMHVLTSSICGGGGGGGRGYGVQTPPPPFGSENFFSFFCLSERLVMYDGYPYSVSGKLTQKF